MGIRALVDRLTQGKLRTKADVECIADPLASTEGGFKACRAEFMGLRSDAASKARPGFSHGHKAGIVGDLIRRYSEEGAHKAWY